jgi:hypothetical protein
MPRACRDWLRFSWSLIIFLGLAAAVACASHPLGHDHDAGHPPLCTDSSSAVTLGHGKPILSSDGGTWPLSQISPPHRISGRARCSTFSGSAGMARSPL